MKRFTKICLIAAAVLLLCGIGASAAGYIAGARRDIKTTVHASNQSAETIDLPGDSIGAARFFLTYDDVIVVPSKDSMLHVEYTPEDGHTYSYELTEAAQNGSQCFTFRSSDNVHGFHLFSVNFAGWSQESTVRISLPAHMSLEIETASGEIALKSMTVQEATLSTTSGDIFVEALSCGPLSVSTTSGEMDLMGCSVAALSASSTSGDLECSGCAISGEAVISTTSGEIDLEQATISEGPGSFSSVSGDISLSRSECHGKLDFSTTSGEIELEQVLAELDLDAETISGDVAIALCGGAPHRVATSTVSGAVSVSGDDSGGMHQITVSTTSGGIEIRDGVSSASFDEDGELYDYDDDHDDDHNYDHETGHHAEHD